ncbi:Uncharacterised protein [Bordetella pertussis]|nr:Uncharacterised protein [Bordetella pertussis]
MQCRSWLATMGTPGPTMARSRPISSPSVSSCPSAEDAP